MSFSGGGQESKTSVRTNQLQKNTYQDYAGNIVNQMYPQIQELFGRTMGQYADKGFEMSPEEQQAYAASTRQIKGMTPEQMTGAGYLTPYMGEGWMKTLEPYYAAQEANVRSALPQQEQEYIKSLKNQFGPAWGTSGKALDAASNSYANWKSNMASQLAAINATKLRLPKQGCNILDRCYQLGNKRLVPMLKGNKLLIGMEHPQIFMLRGKHSMDKQCSLGLIY